MRRRINWTSTLLYSLLIVFSLGAVSQDEATAERAVKSGIVTDFNLENETLSLAVPGEGKLQVRLADRPMLLRLKPCPLEAIDDGDRVVAFGQFSADRTSFAVANLRRIHPDRPLRARTASTAIHAGILRRNGAEIAFEVGDQTVRMSEPPVRVWDEVNVAFDKVQVGQKATASGEMEGMSLVAATLVFSGRGGRTALATAHYEGTPGLPNVLLIGDSISIGYTMPVRDALDGKANVYRPLENAMDTFRGLEKLEEWLGERDWAVIHFNWGLHDLKYMQGRQLSFEGEQNTPIETYEANLRTLVASLKQTGAKLIWATSTPVPEGAEGRRSEDVLRYNATARSVMEELGMPINYLNAAVMPRHEAIMLRPGNVHYSEEGSEFLARQVVEAIEVRLP